MSALERYRAIERIADASMGGEQLVDLRCFTKILGDGEQLELPSRAPAIVDAANPPRFGTLWRPVGETAWRGGAVDLAELSPRIHVEPPFGVGLHAASTVVGYDIRLFRFLEGGDQLVMDLFTGTEMLYYERFGYRFYDLRSCAVTNVQINPKIKPGEIRWATARFW